MEWNEWNIKENLFPVRMSGPLHLDRLAPPSLTSASSLHVHTTSQPPLMSNRFGFSQSTSQWLGRKTQCLMQVIKRQSGIFGTGSASVLELSISRVTWYTLTNIFTTKYLSELRGVEPLFVVGDMTHPLFETCFIMGRLPCHFFFFYTIRYWIHVHYMLHVHANPTNHLILQIYCLLLGWENVCSIGAKSLVSNT